MEYLSTPAIRAAMYLQLCHKVLHASNTWKSLQNVKQIQAEIEDIKAEISSEFRNLGTYRELYNETVQLVNQIRRTETNSLELENVQLYLDAFDLWIEEKEKTLENLEMRLYEQQDYADTRQQVLEITLAHIFRQRPSLT